MDLSMYGENLNFSSSDEISSDEESGNIKEVYEQSLSIIENNCLPTRDIVYEGKKKLIYHCNSHEEALNCVKKYELATTTRFVVYSVTKDFGITDFNHTLILILH
ncbi:uncharacterized protein LOC124818542 [Hydra vulgaris]|uniref:uncharacterized protein LOC124818542 n=1 Tax=Hydra vulgaris TaxID=6087 RepID=UPI001F5F68B0|nr:uncharacterized protein LOC124818542 [Hydra vulgaris]